MKKISWLFAMVFSVMMMLVALPSQAMAAEVQQPSKEDVQLAQGLAVDNLPELAAAEGGTLVATGMSIDNLPPEPAAVEEGVVTPTAAGNTVFACVNANGTLAPPQSFGATGSGKVPTDGAGRYEVFFNRNVRNCAYLATVGLCGYQGATIPPGEISTVGRYSAVNGVYVVTTNSAGAGQDKPFYLEVQCP